VGISPLNVGSCMALSGVGVGCGAGGVCIIPAHAGQVRASNRAAVAMVFRIALSLFLL
jgi:hypothetical protein